VDGGQQSRPPSTLTVRITSERRIDDRHRRRMAGSCLLAPTGAWSSVPKGGSLRSSWSTVPWKRVWQLTTRRSQTVVKVQLFGSPTAVIHTGGN